MGSRFFHVTLRTTDVDAARAFYAVVLGGRQLDIVQLHEQALARGARPHWLGYLEVPNVAAAAEEFVQRGASQLGKWVNPQGLEAAVLRDPGGAIVAVAKPAPGMHGNIESADVIWCLLNTRDVERAKSNYETLFAWEFKEPLDLGQHGVFHPFAWDHGKAPAGSMRDVATRSGVHPHWLFHFRVPSVEGAIACVRNAGGKVLDPLTLPNGERIAVCDDPQGAAFTVRGTS